MTWHFGSPAARAAFQEMEGRNPKCLKTIPREIADHYIRTNSNLPCEAASLFINNSEVWQEMKQTSEGSSQSGVSAHALPNFMWHVVTLLLRIIKELGMIPRTLLTFLLSFCSPHIIIV